MSFYFAFRRIFFCSCTFFPAGDLRRKLSVKAKKYAKFLRGRHEFFSLLPSSSWKFFGLVVVVFFYHFYVGKFHFRRSGTSGKISELSRKSAFGNWLMPQDWREISRGQDRNPEKMTHFKKTSMRTSPLKFENCSRPFWCTYEKQLRTHFGGVSLAFPCIHYSELLSKWGGWREGRLV